MDISMETTLLTPAWAAARHLPRLLVVILVMIGPATTLSAQDYYGKYNFTLGAGAAVPQQDLDNAFTPAPVVNFNFGYRFARNFQADIGFDTVFGAADIRTFTRTDIGTLEINDRQYFFPVGGRVVVPFGESGRNEFYAGGGGAYMRYSEVIRQPSDFFRIPCDVCSRRAGWGGYGLVGFRSSINRGRNLWVGVTTKVYRGRTDGEQFGEVPPMRTQDRWLMVQGEFSFAF